MAGRGRGQSALGGSGLAPASGTGGFPQPPLLPAQQSIPIPVVLIEQKMATQHAEIQKLLTENQRLAATHVALRQELSAAHQEAQRLQQLKSSMQAESEGKFLALLERTANLEAELNGIEPLKVELQSVSEVALQSMAHKQELAAQAEQLTAELKSSSVDAEKVRALELNNENLQEDLDHARAALEYEKKASLHQEEQKQAMEKTLILLAKEVEKLHKELTNVKKAKANSVQGAAYGTGVWANESGYALPQSIQKDDYGRHKGGALNSNGRAVKTGESTGLDEPKQQQAQESIHGTLSPMQNISVARSEPKPTEIWNTHVAPNGRTFYHNPLTGVTQWDRPMTFETTESQVIHQTHSQLLPQHQAQTSVSQMQQTVNEVFPSRQLQTQQYGEVPNQHPVQAAAFQIQQTVNEVFPSRQLQTHQYGVVSNQHQLQAAASQIQQTANEVFPSRQLQTLQYGEVPNQHQMQASQMQQAANEVFPSRQLQTLQYGEAPNHQAPKMVQVQQQQAIQNSPYFQSQYMQPMRSQFQDPQVGQGHMPQLAAQMSQVIQGQFVYPVQGQPTMPSHFT